MRVRLICKPFSQFLQPGCGQFPFYFSNAEITSSFSLCLENLKDNSRIFWKDIVNWIKENILSLYLVLKVDKMVRKYFDT